MDNDADPRSKDGRIFVLAAWASMSAAFAVFAVLMYWITQHDPERFPGRGFSFFFFLTSAGGGLAAFMSLLAIQRWKRGRFYVLVTWASIMLILILYWLGIAVLDGQRPPAELSIYLFVLLASAAGGLTGFLGLIAYKQKGIKAAWATFFLGPLVLPLVPGLLMTESFEWLFPVILMAPIHTGVILGAYISSLVDQKSKDDRVYILAAWASPLVGIAAVVILFNFERLGMKGSNELISCGLLALLSAGGGLTGLFSLFGVRSRWKALLIIPGALMGICINGYISFLMLAAFSGIGRLAHG
jgi:hypothetical protein